MSGGSIHDELGAVGWNASSPLSQLLIFSQLPLHSPLSDDYAMRSKPALRIFSVFVPSVTARRAPPMPKARSHRRAGFARIELV